METDNGIASQADQQANHQATDLDNSCEHNKSNKSDVERQSLDEYEQVSAATDEGNIDRQSDDDPPLTYAEVLSGAKLSNSDHIEAATTSSSEAPREERPKRRRARCKPKSEGVKPQSATSEAARAIISYGRERASFTPTEAVVGGADDKDAGVSSLNPNGLPENTEGQNENSSNVPNNNNCPQLANNSVDVGNKGTSISAIHGQNDWTILPDVHRAIPTNQDIVDENRSNERKRPYKAGTSLGSNVTDQQKFIATSTSSQLNSLHLGPIPAPNPMHIQQAKLMKEARDRLRSKNPTKAMQLSRATMANNNR